jgi:uncharacterized membrane protein YdbT with pleckstrin-like domain
MAPTLICVGIASLLVWTGKWYLQELSELAERIGSLVMFAIAWCVWPGLLGVFVYRTVTFTYRLTDRAVFIDFGFWYPPVPPVWLSEVTAVRVGYGWFSRLLGVGWVELCTPGTTLRLLGVRNPEAFVVELVLAMSAAKASEKETEDSEQKTEVGTQSAE